MKKHLPEKTSSDIEKTCNIRILQKSALVFICLIVFSISNLFAVPAYPGLINFKQPDGKTIRIYMKGDEKVRWAETDDGYSILVNSHGFYEFAVMDSYGDMVTSGVIASNSEDRTNQVQHFLSSVPKHIKYSATQISMSQQIWQIYQSERGGSRAFPTTGDRKLICILIGFTDKAFTKTQATFNNLFNQINYNGTGSVYDFFYESSYGQLRLNVDVFGPYTASNTMAYYGANDVSGNDLRPRELVTEAVNLADAGGANFALYDNDGNGTVDGVYVIYAGYGEEAGGGADCIWAHAWGITPVTKDGKTVSTYSCSAELSGNSGSNTTNIGVICHEFGHTLGAPDFYDTNYGTGGQYDGTGKWDLQASGLWNGSGGTYALMGNKPAQPNAYTKCYIYGWATPRTLSACESITLLNSSFNSNSFFRYNTTTANEYFLIENRQQVGFDTYVPGHGLIIYHVDQPYTTSNPSSVNASAHQGMYIVPANSATANGVVTGGGPCNTAGCPYRTVTSFTDATTPNSKSWANNNTSKPLTSITETAGVITLDFMGGGCPCSMPSTQSSSFASSSITDNSITISWTRGNGNSVIVLAKQGSAVDANPISSLGFSANSVFGSGSQIGTGNYVVYNGTGTSVNVTGLNAGTQYYFAVYEYESTKYCYKTPAMTGNASTIIAGACTPNIDVTATAGTLTGSYSTLKDAFDKINDGTHRGAITIKIGKNSTETLSAVLNASGTGSSNYTSVLIQPCDGSYTVTGNLSGNPLINLNGADNVTIDGINSGGNMLTFGNTNTNANSSTIQFINDATFNTVKNCNIYSSNSSVNSGTIVFGTTTGANGNDNNTIEYCKIYDGASTPYVAIYSAGTTTTAARYNSNNTISNNEIFNFINPGGDDGTDTPGSGIFTAGTDFGIKLVAGTTGWTIKDNSFYRTRTTLNYTNVTYTATHYGIYITEKSNNCGGFTITNNYIGGSAANCAGADAWTFGPTTRKGNFRGIHVITGSTSQSDISNNTIDHINITTSASGTAQDCVFGGIMVNGYHKVNSNTLGTATYGITVNGTTGNCDTDGICYFEEGGSAPASFECSNNNLLKISVNNSAGNASFYGIRAYSKNYALTFNCLNNVVGDNVANSIMLTGTADSWVHGIFLSWGVSANMNGNTIRNITSNRGNINGIKFQSDNVSGITATYSLAQNTIYNLTQTGVAAGSVFGIMLNGNRSTNNVIERNFVHTLSAATIYGIYLENNYGGYSDIVRNNMIALSQNTSTDMYGIYYGSTTGTCDILHNSVYIGGNEPSTKMSSCIRKATSATTCRIIGNICYNARTGGASRYALYYDNVTGLTTSNSNCNDLYAPGGNIGRRLTIDYPTFVGWQTVYDANSKNLDPGFVSTAAPYDLHVPVGILSTCTGYVTNDFDGDSRTKPHIGADEATSTLPVNMLEFSAVCFADATQINWTTASETNNKSFTLERSSDLNKWEFVAEIAGAGNSNTPINYQYSDHRQGSVVYYRLKQTDFDGKSETFGPVTVSCNDKTPSFNCYPNPFTNQIVVSWQNIEAEQGSIVLHDITGRVVLRQNMNLSDLEHKTIELSLSHLASGTYSLTVHVGNAEKIMRIVKK